MAIAARPAWPTGAGEGVRVLPRRAAGRRSTAARLPRSGSAPQVGPTRSPAGSLRRFPDTRARRHRRSRARRRHQRPAPAPEARYAWPRHRDRSVGTDGASPLEPADEVADVAVEVAAIAAADADVEVVALGDAPPVPFEIAAEVQLRRAGHRRSPSSAHTELRFLGHDRRRAFRAPPRRCAGDRTEVPAGANDDRRFDLLVGYPGVSRSTAGDRSASPRARARRNVAAESHRTRIGESRS